MQELDRPATEACGDSPMSPSMPMSIPSMPEKPDTPPPTMSINLNAQGLDNIEELMKLVKSVNPDMDKPASPISAISIEPMDKPMGGLPPLKMLPDMDSEPHDEPDADNMGGPSDMDADNMPPMGDLDSDDGDNVTKAMGDIDSDGDHDTDDHKAEKNGPEDDKEPTDDEEKKDEEFGNSVAGSAGSDYKDIDYMNNQLAGGMNGPKKSYSGKPYRGDNPMAAGAYESRDALRASIRSELQQRLAEAKGAK